MKNIHDTDDAYTGIMKNLGFEKKVKIDESKYDLESLTGVKKESLTKDHGLK